MFISKNERDQLEQEHIEKFRDYEAKTFVIIPTQLLMSDKLSDGEKMFYIKLTALSDKTTGTLLHANDTIAEELDCSMSNVFKFLDSLKKKNAIQTLSTGRNRKRIICLTPWNIL